MIFLFKIMNFKNITAALSSSAEKPQVFLRVVQKLKNSLKEQNSPALLGFSMLMRVIGIVSARNEMPYSDLLNIFA